MIWDKINSSTITWLQSGSQVLHAAFDWIKAMPEKPEHGVCEWEGNAFYVNVHGYDTLNADECLWESHRHTVDIQYCIRGGEII